jgi:hypothetical protein
MNRIEKGEPLNMDINKECTIARYPFPFIECDEHPGPQHGYIVCVHVIEGTAGTWMVLPASDTDVGHIVCERGPDHEVDELRLLCGEYAKQWLLGPLMN